MVNPLISQELQEDHKCTVNYDGITIYTHLQIAAWKHLPEEWQPPLTPVGATPTPVSKLSGVFPVLASGEYPNHTWRRHLVAVQPITGSELNNESCRKI